ncbi:hypothetical protein RJ639_022788 [Escallonia herrerae]|uniref:DUF4220 domain-containing protein n=1 Tax=Escallonia herrerae TaxID=1293975 RepID=A0AA88UYK1_9ASTE|nr:hypothetical protein RJ639_022788 [Escallonia herrerae]
MDPIPRWAQRFWNGWEVRVLILTSLTLQSILSVFGKRRKYSASIWIRIAVWFAYLTADTVATFALGKLSDAQMVDSADNALWVVWGPLLLLHLGGPDSITAYAVEDNKLWLRHLLGFLVQVVVVAYAILVSWRGSWFSFLSLPVLAAGSIKYGERIWALKSANLVQSLEVRGPDQVLTASEYPDLNPDAQVVQVAHDTWSLFQPHIENNVIGDAATSSISIWFTWYFHWLQDDGGTKRLWEVFEVEMGFMFDMLYTKAPIIHTILGSLLRSICFSCTTLALVGFFLIYSLDKKTGANQSHVDIIITGVLLVVAFVWETYALAVALSSDWMVLQHTKHPQASKLATQFFARFLNFSFILGKRRPRWSNLMGQFNIVSFCLAKKPQLPISNLILRVFGVEEEFSKIMHKTLFYVPQYLRKRIITYVSLGAEVPLEAESFVLATSPQFHTLGLPLDLHKEPFSTSGERTVSQYGVDRTLNGFLKAEFGERVYIMYLVTKLVLYDHQLSSEVSPTQEETREACKILSEYMVYLLFCCPSVLPVTWDTYAPRLKNIAIENSLSHLKVFMQNTPSGDEQGACKLLEEAVRTLGENIKAETRIRAGKLLEEALGILSEKLNGKIMPRYQEPSEKVVLTEVEDKVQHASQILRKTSLEGDQLRALEYLQEASEILNFLQNRNGQYVFVHTYATFATKLRRGFRMHSNVENLRKSNYDDSGPNMDMVLGLNIQMRNAACEDIEEAVEVLRRSSSSNEHGRNKVCKFSGNALELLDLLVTEREQKNELLVTIAETLGVLRNISCLEFLNDMWMEMLCYAAKECPLNSQLDRPGTMSLKSGVLLVVEIMLHSSQTFHDKNVVERKRGEVGSKFVKKGMKVNLVGEELSGGLLNGLLKGSELVKKGGMVGSDRSG